MKGRRVLIPALFSVALCMPFGGFLFGLFHCEDCGWNPASRALIGFFFAVLTPFSRGFPPKNEGGVGEPFNAWPSIGIAAVVIFVIVAVVMNLRRDPNN
jgi:uncharacterized membrane protein